MAEKVGKDGPEPEGSSTMNDPIYPGNYQVNQLNQLEANITQTFNSQFSFAMLPSLSLLSLLNACQTPAQTTNLDNNAPFIPQQNIQTPIKRSFNSLNYGNNDRNEEQYHRQESTFNHTNSIDLRRKLELARTKRSCSESFSYNDGDFQPGNKRIKHVMKDRVVQIVPMSAPAVKDQPLNLAALKTLTATNPESNKWLIVAERDVILENYTFLDDMVAPDPDIQLVVPHHVLSELKTYVSGSSDVRPRRTLRFLAKQIEDDIVILGKPEEAHTSFEKTMLTCFTLATNNNVVILITKEEQTLSSTPNPNFHKFTMRAMKDILESKSTKPMPFLTHSAAVRYLKSG